MQMKHILLILGLFLSFYPVYSADAYVYGRYSGSYGSWENVISTTQYPGLNQLYNGILFVPVDYQNDGDIDIIAKYDAAGCPTTGNGKCFAVFVNSGGSYSPQHLASIGDNFCANVNYDFNPPQAQTQEASHMQIADVTSDGVPDFLVNCFGSVWYDHGFGGGTFGSGFNRANIYCSRDYVVGDINNDGRNDYFCSDGTQGIHTGGGDNPQWSTSQAIPTWSHLGTPTIGFLDFNGDGYKDIRRMDVTYSNNVYTTHHKFYRGNGGSSWSYDSAITSSGVESVVFTSERGNKFNTEPGYVRATGDLYLDRDISIGDVGGDSNRFEFIIDGNGQPWLYSKSTNAIIRARLSELVTYHYEVDRLIQNPIETNTFDYTFGEKDKYSWKGNSYVSIPYQDAWRIDSVTGISSYVIDTANKKVNATLPLTISPGTRYVITVTGRVAPDHNGTGSSILIPWTNSASVSLNGKWKTWNGGTGLGGSIVPGCRYSIGPSSGSNSTTNWKNCPQQPSDGQTTDFVPTFSIPSSDLVEGNNYINFRVKNKNGYEIFVPGVYLVQIDNVAPVTDDNYNSGSWSAADVSVALTCSDSTSGCLQTKYCIIDEDQSCTPSAVGNTVSVSCSLGQVCKKKIYYYSTDLAGNQESTKSVIVRIDKQKPSTTYSISPSSPNGENSWYVSSPTITLSCSDSSGSGCQNIKYCTDQTNTCSPTIVYASSFTPNYQGNVYVRFYSTDNTNNQENVISRNYKVDTVSPQIYNSPLVDTLSSTSQRISAPNAHDATSGIQRYKIKDTEVLPNYEQESDSSTITVNNLGANTKHTWYVKLKDNAGNWNDYLGSPTQKWTLANPITNLAISANNQNSTNSPTNTTSIINNATSAVSGTVNTTIDTVIRTKDYLISEVNRVANSVRLTHGFEDGMHPFTTYGNSHWAITSSSKNSGQYSVTNGDVRSAGEESVLRLDYTLSKNGYIIFFRQSNAESPYTGSNPYRLEFYIDGALQNPYNGPIYIGGILPTTIHYDQWYGNWFWEPAVFSVPAGTHTFEWKYKRFTTSTTSNPGRVWIDDIKIQEIA